MSMDRRAWLGAAAAFTVVGAVGVDAASGAVGVDAGLMYRKMHFRSDDGLVFWWLQGVKYGQVGTTLTPLYTASIGTLQRADRSCVERGQRGADLSIFHALQPPEHQAVVTAKMHLAIHQTCIDAHRAARSIDADGAHNGKSRCRTQPRATVHRHHCVPHTIGNSSSGGGASMRINPVDSKVGILMVKGFGAHRTSSPSQRVVSAIRRPVFVALRGNEA